MAKLLCIWLAENDRLDVVKLLIEKGVDLNATDNDGKTPLYLAVENGRLDYSRILYRGKNIDVISKTMMIVHFLT